MAPKLNAVLIAVKDLEEAVGVYSKALGRQPTEVAKEPHDGMRNALFPVGDALIELVQPADPQGPVARFIERKGEGLYMLSLEVEDFAAQLKALRQKGVPVTEMEMAAGPSRHWGFIHPRATHGVLIGFFQRD